MNLWQLNIFHKVIKLQSFSKAAEAVNLSQPTVSSHIKSLEEYYNCKLIDRLERKAVPTSAGTLLFQHVDEILASMNGLASAMARFQEKISGRVEIGASTIPSGFILPKIIADFSKKFPEVLVAMIVGDSEKIISDVARADIEMGVVGASTDEERVIQVELLRDELKLIVPADHKWAEKATVSLKSLVKEPFIIRESGSGTLAAIKKSLATHSSHPAELNIVAELGSATAVIQGIRSKLGVSILSPIAVEADLNTGRLKAIKIKGVDLSRSFYLTRHKNKTPSPSGLAFSDFLLSTYSKH